MGECLDGVECTTDGFLPIAILVAGIPEGWLARA